MYLTNSRMYPVIYVTMLTDNVNDQFIRSFHRQYSCYCHKTFIPSMPAVISVKYSVCRHLHVSMLKRSVNPNVTVKNNIGLQYLVVAMAFRKIIFDVLLLMRTGSSVRGVIFSAPPNLIIGLDKNQ